MRNFSDYMDDKLLFLIRILQKKLSAFIRKKNGFLSFKNGGTYSNHQNIMGETMRNFTDNVNYKLFFINKNFTKDSSSL